MPNALHEEDSANGIRVDNISVTYRNGHTALRSACFGSPGGSITAGMAIYDVMQFIKPDVQTVCVGMAASMGAFLLAAGTKGKRYALPNAEVMIHQPLGGAQGQATEIEIAAKRILFLREKLNTILSERTGQPLEVISKDTDRDNFMTAERALEYGLIDQIITRSKMPEHVKEDI